MINIQPLLYILKSLKFVLTIIGYAILSIVSKIANIFAMYCQLLLIPEYTLPLIFIGFAVYTMIYYAPANRATKDFGYMLLNYMKDYTRELCNYYIINPITMLGHRLNKAIFENIINPCSEAFTVATVFVSETLAYTSESFISLFMCRKTAPTPSNFNVHDGYNPYDNFPSDYGDNDI